MSDDKKPEDTTTATEEKPDEDENGLVPTEEIVADDGTGSKFALVQTRTGEEDEEIVWKAKARAYRFDEGENEWKERGTGEIKFLKSKTDGNARILMRREHIHKVCVAMNMANVGPIKEHSGSDKVWVFAGMDYSEAEGDDDEATRETISLRFGSVENAQAFKKHYIECGGPA